MQYVKRWWYVWAAAGCLLVLVIVLAARTFDRAAETVDLAAGVQVAADAVDAVTEVQKAPEPVDATAKAQEAAKAVGGTVGQQLVSGIPYFGLKTLEEGVSGANAIVRAELLSVSQGVERVNDEFSPALIFRFRVLEYLKGSGGTEIVAATIETDGYETRAEAEAQAGDLLAPRDKRWDDREAVLFLGSGWLEDNHYWIGFRSYYGEDGYTVASRHYRNWLPAAAGQTGGPTGSPDSRRFLLGLDSSGAEGETITLGELKSKIAGIEAEIAAGGGSLEYRVCVANKYLVERWSAHNVSKFGGSYNFDPVEHALASGLVAETFVYENLKAYGKLSRYGENPSEMPYRYWLEGEDNDLFDVRYPGRVFTQRPLPAGRYQFYYNDQESELALCNAYPEAERTRFGHLVTVTAPDGVLHEAFFDPVTVGNTVSADGANGVLKPVSFTASNGASATLRSIAWEPPSTGSGGGTVKVRVVPWSSLSGKVLDFIELDGTVSTSLEVAGATVDAANDTLSWSLSLPPWEDGDKLMVRIKR